MEQGQRWVPGGPAQDMWRVRWAEGWRPGGQAGAKAQVGEDREERRPELGLELGPGQEGPEGLQLDEGTGEG